jgi:hypothetical protein
MAGFVAAMPKAGEPKCDESIAIMAMPDPLLQSRGQPSRAADRSDVDQSFPRIRLRITP